MKFLGLPWETADPQGVGCEMRCRDRQGKPHPPHSPSLWSQERAATHCSHGVDAVDVVIRPAGRQLVGVLLLLEWEEGTV